ncbi:MltA domain-containing protein [uncultured Desulfobacter sp.]|uniref:murein transglycosylase A n=1 Tax=uncultured Desulfobacter sp. TaxID=240139 RepID=UPI002AA81EF1|nr:MltA domain-containing protein [uncultured Desulfobacter sp.]
MNRLVQTPVLFYLLLMLLLAGPLGCRNQKKVESLRVNPLVKVPESDLPEFTDAFFLQDLGRSIDQSLVYFKRVPATRTYAYGRDVYTAAHMILSLETFKNFLETKPSTKNLNRFIRERYTVYKSVGGSKKDVLFTGYFEPTYPGSRTPGPEFPWPVYPMPDDLFQVDLSEFSDAYKGHKRLMARVDPKSRRVRPYYTRKQINRQSDFQQKAPPVVWLANRIDRFFLEIQGSGRVALPHGEIVRLHYAGVNGRKYSAVGRYLIDQNEVPKEKMSMQTIRKWLTAHPERMDEVLFTNESFVFFKEGEGGPFGCINVAVTPVRSIATDTKLFPKGGLAFIQTALPVAVGQPKEAWPRASLFVLNQDTGGAINGPGRVDLFCGAGDWADYTAGHMVARGQLYFLVLTRQN